MACKNKMSACLLHMCLIPLLQQGPGARKLVNTGEAGSKKGKIKVSVS
jgi:hypothetical protein